MKNSIIYLIIASFLTSCVNDSVQDLPKEKNDSVDSSKKVNTLKLLKKESIVNARNIQNKKLSGEFHRDKDSYLNKYLNKNFKNNDLYGSTGNKLSEEELEKKLKLEYANIDPLEYYLQNNPKYTDKKAMFEKQDELSKLIEIYRKKFYDKGHLQEMRENNAVLISLISDAYPSVLYEKYDSISNKSNSNLVNLKKNNSISFVEYSSDPLSEINRAVQLILKSNYDSANKILSQLVTETLSNNYLANYNKGFVSFKIGDYKTSIKYANRSILARDDFYLGYLLLGESYLSIGDYNQALKAFQQSLKIKNNVVSMERVAYAYALKGDYFEAFRLYSDILDSPKDHGFKNYKALKAFSKIPFDDKNETLITAKFLAKTYSEWPVPSLIQAFKELNVRNYNEASKHCFEASELGENFYSKLCLAIASYKSKDFNTASKLFLTLNLNKEFEQFKYHKELLLMQIFSYTNTNLIADAYLKLKDYVSYHKKDEYYYLAMSLVSYDRFDFKTAEIYLDSIKNDKIFETDYTYLKGLYALRNNNLNTAKIYFNKSNAKNPNIRAFNGLGAIYNEKGDYKSAIELFEKSLLEEPNNPFLLFNKASSLFLKAKDLKGQNDTLNAREAVEFGTDLLRKAKSINNIFIIDMNIGNAYNNIQDYSKSLYYYNLNPSNYSNVNIGVVHARSNNLSEGKEIWENVMLIDPKVDLAKYNIVETEKSNPTYKSYYYYYYDVNVNVDIPVPILFDRMFEPLVPLGNSSFKFHTLTKD